MKKYIVLIGMLLVFAVTAVSANAAIDQTKSVTFTATIIGSTSMSISPATAEFGDTGVDAFPTTPGDAKIVITYNSNYSPWKIAIYTDNTQVPDYGETDGRYSKGGLATADGKQVIPCKWVAKIGSNTTVPTVPSFTSAHNFLKDKSDQDDPLTTAYDESWATAFGAGYANIAYGAGPGPSGFCVDPTVGDPYQGDAVNGSIAVYVAGLFGTGANTAGIYSSNIYFDLYHE